MTRVCIMCRERFTPKANNQKYCSAVCRKPPPAEIKKAKKVKPTLSITQVAALARKNKMTYGQYVQQMEGRGDD